MDIENSVQKVVVIVNISHMEQRKVEPAMIIKKKTLSECVPRWIHVVCMFGFIPVTIKKDEIVFKYFSLKMLLMIILMNLGHLIMGIPYYIFDPENSISFFFKMANHAANLNATDLFSNITFFFTNAVGFCMPILFASNFCKIPNEIFLNDESKWPKYGTIIVFVSILESIGRILINHPLRSSQMNNFNATTTQAIVVYACEILGNCFTTMFYAVHNLIFLLVIQKYGTFFKNNLENPMRCLKLFQDLKIAFEKYLFYSFGCLQLFGIISAYLAVSPFIGTGREKIQIWMILTFFGYFFQMISPITFVMGR